MSNRINIVKGTSKVLEVDLVDVSGDPISLEALAGAVATLIVRVDPASPPDLISFDTTTTPTSLAFKVDAAALIVTFAPTDTSSLAVQAYSYQIEITLPAGEVVPVIEWSPLDVTLGGSATPTPPPFDNTVKIDENFRLPNDLAYVTPAGSPIENAQVRVYLKSDYDAGNLDTPIGFTTTNAFGGWVNPILVRPGFTYVVRFEKPKEWGPNTQEFFA